MTLYSLQRCRATRQQISQAVQGYPPIDLPSDEDHPLTRQSQCQTTRQQISPVVQVFLKSAKTISFLLDTDTVNTALHPVYLPCFLCAIFFFNPISQSILSSFVLLGNSSLPLLGLPPLLTFLKTCLKLTMVRSLLRQLPLRSSFAPTMRRNRLSGSASSRNSSLRRDQVGWVCDEYLEKL